MVYNYLKLNYNEGLKFTVLLNGISNIMNHLTKPILYCNKWTVWRF